MSGQITLLRLQRARTTAHYTQGAASLALGYALLRLQRVLVNVFSASK
ncbi:MAG: hypothetical protein PUE15_04000 [Prevotella sp.]|nr:hypothetical protein [Prevotella sp.]MDY3670664.1 hypothetical protein [Prevotella sp.]